MITETIEIERPPRDVFAYIEDLERHGEWQDAIVSVRKEPAGPTRLGTRNIETRRVPGGPREFTTEVVEYDPPRRIAARGLGGPIRASIGLTIEPAGDGSRARVRMDLDLQGYGIGKVFVLFARRAARKEVPRNLRHLKERLEGRPADESHAAAGGAGA